MAYTTINKPNQYFNTVLYSGNGSTQSITGVGFQPDFTWLKERSAAGNHKLADVVRGTTKYLSSNLTDAEDTTGSGIQSWNSDGFSLSNATDINDNGITYASWNWKANGAGVSNTQGSITSTVSANTTSGFSIFTYTGTGASTTTVGHGCSSEPKFVFIKNRSNVSGWVTYHYGAGATGLGNPNQASLILNGTNASANPASMGYLSDGYFSNVNSTTITLRDVNNANNVNANGNNYVGYAFAEVKGFSKFGSYVGNGNADGTFVYTGFKPAFVICRVVNSAVDWHLFDNKRLGYNTSQYVLKPNSSGTEFIQSSILIDFLSNGFKFRGTDSAMNGSGQPHIYMAFAEQPLVGTNNVPATAR